MVRTSIYSKAIAAFLVLALVFSLVLIHSEAVTITDIAPKVGATGNIDGYDVSNPNNLYVTGTPTDNFVVDAQLENSDNIKESQTAYLFGKEAKEVIRDYSSEGVTARSGSKCAKISEKTTFALPTMQDNTYYILSFYIYSKNPNPNNGAWSTRFTYRNKVTTFANDFFFSETDYSDFVLNSWSKISFVIYTGHREQMIKMIFANSGRFNANTTFYIDDFSLIALPDDVQQAARAFDEHGEITSYDTNLLNAVGTVFKSDTYANLCSPIQPKVKYASLYDDLVNYNPNSISNKTPYVGATGNLDGYNAANSENLFTATPSSDNRVVDAQLENSDAVTDTGYFYGKEAKEIIGDYSSEGVTAHSGSKCAKISEKSIFTLPNLKKNTYYIFSFYMYSKNPVPTNGEWASRFVYRNLVTTSNKDFYFDSNISDVTPDSWCQVSFVIWSGNHEQYIKLILGQSAFFKSSTVFYVDDFSMIELPKDVQASAKLFDEYKGELSEDDGTLLQSVGKVFAKITYENLCSPVKSGVRYRDMYKELANIEDAYGFMSYNDPFTCLAENNVIANPQCDDATYWSTDSVNYGNVAAISNEYSYEDGTSLKITGNGSEYIKYINVSPNTFYYLSLYGMTPQESEVNDINFGFIDSDGSHIENIRAESDLSYVKKATTFEFITINGQDGLWHNRTYKFYTGSYTKMGLFVTGTNGVMYLDEIRVFKANDGIGLETPKTNMPENIENDIVEFACAPEDNLISNGFFDTGSSGWDKERGYGRFTEVVKSEGNTMLYYRNNGDNFYYMPMFEVERNKTYTFSFWAKTIDGAGGIFTVANGSRPRNPLLESVEVADCHGEWKLYSMSFLSADDTSVCFALYDGGGEAVFDNFRLFESSKGFALPLNEDQPVGGDNIVSNLKKPILNPDSKDSYEEGDEEEELYPSEPSEPFEDNENLFDDEQYDTDYEQSDMDEEQSDTDDVIVSEPEDLTINSDSKGSSDDGQTDKSNQTVKIILIAVIAVAVIGTGLIVLFALKRRKNKNKV